MMKRIVVLGAGESGIGAALLAKKQGLDVFVSDQGMLADNFKGELTENQIPFEEGGHSMDRILDCDTVIKSPGIPDSASVVQKLKEAGKKVISEIEFGSLFYQGEIIAVTGSNGKTTTSGLLYHVLKNAGKSVALGGNYGKSFARIVAESAPELIVVEVSSFQLDDIETFHPNIAILLNITPDHLDRYSYSLFKYADAKFRVALNQDAADYFIYNADDPETMHKLSASQLRAATLGIYANLYMEGIPSLDGSGNFEISIQGKHNLFNAMCVVAACRRLGLSEQEIGSGLKSFVNLPHRLEVCGVVSGVTYINDSKATNVDSVYYALDAMEKPVVWIAGGTDKGNEYDVLLPLIEEKVNALICLGVDNAKLVHFFKPWIPVIAETKDVVEAVEMGLRFADPDDVVLLSPACASFDLFKNYMDRGDQFKAAVVALKNKVENNN
ncbi:MAG: UDP-N-acetylmuramoyl-L-alanine--D-glutamate ligase [Chitinophagales bacterium]|nr:UDP-N-acetylmuramoyl-L-alanine--D-glutamate ligase [Chitinophagales bacterium]